MNIAELLDELRVNILHDRSDRVAGSSDFLWSDATLVRYINEAQKRFARQGLVIRDGTTPEVTQVTLVEGQTEYPLHQSVLAVLSARVTGDSGDLTRAGHSVFDTYHQPDPVFFDSSTYQALAPGKPLAFSMDEYLSETDEGSISVATMRIYPEPSAEYAGTVVNLRVVRLPLEAMDLTGTCETPEIPEVHHLDMLDWAAYLALRIVDHDAGDVARAMEFRGSFDAAVKEARRVAMRKMFTPLPWGFGRNGFTWES